MLPGGCVFLLLCKRCIGPTLLSFTDLILMIYEFYENDRGAGGSMHVCHKADPGSIPGQDKFPG